MNLQARAADGPSYPPAGGSSPAPIEKFLVFGDSSRAAIEQLGLRWTSIEEIFLCARFPASTGFLLDGCPKGSIVYQTRERRAAGQSLLTIRERAFRLPGPWTGTVLSTAIARTAPWHAGLTRLSFVPLYYVFHDGPHVFCVATCGLTGRVVHLYCPTINVVVYEISVGRARLLHEELRAHLPAFVAADAEQRRNGPVDVTAVIDMVTNFGHQMINHLSGLDQLIDDGLCENVSRFLVFGRQFFGRIEDLYPEIASRTVNFSSRDDLAAYIAKNPMLAVRLGSNAFGERTRERILRRLGVAHIRPPVQDRFPVIAVTIRSTDRVCANLRELIEAIYTAFRPRYPGIGFIIDGWVFSELDAAPKAAPIQREADMASDIFRNIPESAVIQSLIGKSILSSIAGVMDIDAYVAHVGTLQHKIAFFASVGGIVHGPETQMKNIDSGAFQTEAGIAPTYLRPTMVRDRPGPNEPARSDYEITDIPGCLARLETLIETARRPAERGPYLSAERKAAR